MKLFIAPLIIYCLTVPSSADAAKGRKTKLPDSQPNEHPAAVQPTNDDKVPDYSLIEKVETNENAKQKEDTTPATGIADKPGVAPWLWAVGTNLSWSFRDDYGARSFRRFEPEVVGYWYMSTPIEKLWLRHGARIGYSDAQPQMPKAVRMEEYDWKASIEEGVTWSGILAPSFSIGVGRDWRTIKIKTKPPVTSADSRLNSKDEFFWAYAQAGLGIPLADGKFLIEPVIRRQYLAHDDRTRWAAGIELTVGW